MNVWLSPQSEIVIVIPQNTIWLIGIVSYLITNNLFYGGNK